MELLKTGFINVAVGWEDKLWDKADTGVGMGILYVSKWGSQRMAALQADAPLRQN